jgi:hypothetical protein
MLDEFQFGFLYLFRYQKTESAIKATAEKTTSLFGGIGSAVSQKIGALKNTESFRSMEERVSTVAASVKVREFSIEKSLLIVYAFLFSTFSPSLVESIYFS